MSEVTVILKRSLNGINKFQKSTLSALGLKKINQQKTFKDTPALRGQIKVVSHLVSLQKGKGA